MQKLASAQNIELPGMPTYTAPVARPAAPAAHPLSYIQGVLGPSSPVPTPCFLLKNMFSPAEQNPAEEWEYEIYEDVKGECAKFGQVVHVHVDKQSDVSDWGGGQ